MGIDSFSDTEKIHFLARLAHELTVCARSTYGAGTDRVIEPCVLRGYNELQHRVSASLRDYVLGKEGMPLSAVLRMTQDFAAEHGRGEITSSLERLYERTTP